MYKQCTCILTCYIEGAVLNFVYRNLVKRFRDFGSNNIIMKVTWCN